MKNLLLTALFVFALALTACSPAKPDISGEWRLVSYGDSANPTPALPNIDAVIAFESGQVSGNFGCNGFGGEYKLSGDQIKFHGITSTMMFCEETSAQEQGALAVLSENAALQIHLEADLLTMTSADGASVVSLIRK